MQIGEVRTSTMCGPFTILEMGGGRATVRFNKTRYESDFNVSFVRSGQIRDPYYPLVFDKGFKGLGDYDRNDPQFRIWKAAMARAYGVRAREGITVEKRWWSYQDFAADLEELPNMGRQSFELDKDALIPGNKVYRRAACCFLPKAINASLTEVSRTSGVYQIPSGRYNACIYRFGKKHSLGTFDTVREAERVRCIARLEYHTTLAKQYRSVIPRLVYENLRAGKL